MRPRVFVVNEPLRRCEGGHGFERFFDLSPALEYGELVYLLPAGQLHAADMAQYMATLRAGLADYTPDDALVPMGDPWAIGAATALAARAAGGTVTVLVWRRRPGKYERITMTLWDGVHNLENSDAEKSCSTPASA